MAGNGPSITWWAAVYDAFAEKLRLTLTVLGCTSRKDLCARFRAVNPATHCDLERLNKWVQGRAMPRTKKFYDDWIKVLGLDRSSAWLLGCSPEELRAALAARDDGGSPLPSQPARGRRCAVRNDTGIFGGLRALCGAYACYSHAWSPHFRGRLIRGSLSIRPGRRGDLLATYCERLANGTARMDGEVLLTPRTLHVLARDSGSGLPLFFSFIVPGIPGSVMCGVMSGLAFVANEALASTTRALAIRVPDTPEVDASNRYLGQGQRSISEDLQSLGLRLAASDAIDARAAAFFVTEVDQVTVVEQAGFAELLDPLHLAAV